MYLGKRDNMGYAIPPMAIVILIMIGAGIVSCCCYAVIRMFSPEDDGNVFKSPSEEQQQYMAEVRARNVDMICGGRRSQLASKARLYSR